MIQIGPIVMPCRTCDADPGQPCTRTRVGSCRVMLDRFHVKRERDAKLASELIQ